MIHSKFIRIISVLGIIALLTLQYVWLRNSYRMVERDILEKSKMCLKEVMDEELMERMNAKKIDVEFVNESRNYKSRKVFGQKILKMGNIDQTADINISLQDIMILIGKKCSIEKIDTLLQKKLLFPLGFLPEYKLQIIDDSIQFRDTICDKTIYIRLDSKHSLQMTLTSPALSVITKAKYIFIVSILLVLLIGMILLFQLKNMVKEKEFTAFMKDYTRILAHEMRTPVNDIYMLTSRALSDPLMDGEKVTLYNKEKLNQCSKLLLGIDNILLLAKSEHAKIRINKSLTDMRTFIHSIIDKYKNNSFLRKNLTIETHFNPEECKVYMDSELMENVVTNLIENAIKYSNEEVQICITCTIENNHLLLRIKDNGFGISKTDQKRIFQLFERGKKNSGSQTKGFGIGLYYVEKVVKAHQGKISVISQEGVGSEFVMDIPNKFL